MKTNLVAFTLVALIFTSCTTTRTSTIKTMDINNTEITQKPTLVDLDVKETRVIGTAISQQGELLENVKELAISNALKQSNADVLVDPKFETETKGGKTTVTVTGFPASYINFRPLKEEDTKFISIDNAQNDKTNVPEKQKPHKSGAGMIILGTILSICTLALLII